MLAIDLEYDAHMQVDEMLERNGLEGRMLTVQRTQGPLHGHCQGTMLG